MDPLNLLLRKVTDVKFASLESREGMLPVKAQPLISSVCNSSNFVSDAGMLPESNRFELTLNDVKFDMSDSDAGSVPLRFHELNRKLVMPATPLHTTYGEASPALVTPHVHGSWRILLPLQ